VPDDLYSTLDSDDEYSGTTAAREACYSGSSDLLKVLKLKPNSTQARDLLRTATFSDNPEFLQACLRAIPASELNNDEQGGCEALHCLIARGCLTLSWGGMSSEQRAQGVVNCIDALLSQGAKWKPTASDLKSARRCLLEHDGKHIVRVVRLLLYTPGSCASEDLYELCRTPAIRQKIVQADSPLWSELNDVRASAAGG
jgi:hypothetical protein